MGQETESLAATVARLDERQKAQEKELGSVLKVAERAESTAIDAKDAIAQINQSLAAMPQKIVETIDKRGGNRWAIANQWIVVGVALLAPFIAKWLGV